MKKRILIVEDEADAVKLLEFYLQRAGFELTVATDGEQALQLARASPPDLVLLDVMLPGLDGFAVCRLLRQEPRTAAVPVLMTSALAMEFAQKQGLRLGAIEYLVKPFSPRELLARIEQILGRATEGIPAGTTVATR
jgi:two-component system phosphate regulon response regulator PhoB